MFDMAALASFFILLSGGVCSEYGDLFSFEYQDPAGDVLLYNITSNGTTTEKSGLDMKWIRSWEDEHCNVIITVDLKSKDKFIDDNSTKYVVRVLTSPDNSTGFNITYRNHTAELVFFNMTGELNRYEFSSNVSVDEERDDEIMKMEVNITRYLPNVSYFNIDAYTMMVTSNSTYLDYISQLPGHPEYVDPGVEESEDLDNSEDEQNDEGPNLVPLIIFVLLILGLMVIVFIFAVLFINSSKRKKE
jgi:hypothetical protein